MSLENLTAEERAQMNLAQLLLSDPETSKQARRLAKKLKPELKFSDLDLEDQMERTRTENKEVTKALQADLDKEKMGRQRDKMHAKIRDRGLDPEAVEKIMTENGIANYDLAMEVLEARSQSAAPTPNDLEVLDLPSGKIGEVDLWKDPKGYAQRVALDTLNGFRRGRVGVR